MFFDTFERLCEAAGKSKNRVATELGFSNATVTKWKKGAVPKGDTLQKIAEYFGVTADFLLTGEEKEKPAVTEDDELAEYLEQLKTRPEMRMLFSLTKGATKEDVARAVRIIEAALGK